MAEGGHNGLIFLVAAVLTYFVIRKSEQNKKWKKILGGLTSFLGIFGLLLGFMNGGGGFLVQLIYPLIFICVCIYLLYPSNKKFYLITIVICVASAFISIPIKRNYDEEITRTYFRFDNIEHLTDNIDGTVWQHITPGRYWFRAEFKEGKVYFYQASPSDGDWGIPAVLDYSIVDGRYDNTGSKYYAVEWTWHYIEDEVYRLVPQSGIMYMTSSNNSPVNISMTEGDIPAWRD